jgi:hypothetical protein
MHGLHPYPTVHSLLSMSRIYQKKQIHENAWKHASIWKYVMIYLPTQTGSTLILLIELKNFSALAQSPSSNVHRSALPPRNAISDNFLHIIIDYFLHSLLYTILESQAASNWALWHPCSHVPLRVASSTRGLQDYSTIQRKRWQRWKCGLRSRSWETTFEDPATYVDEHGLLVT